MASSNRVAVVGYAQSPVARHAEMTLGALAVDTARRGRRGRRPDGERCGRLRDGQPVPFRRRHAAVDGVSLVSANWLAEHLGVNPRYAAGFQGFGQLPGAVALAVNAVVSGAADYVLLHCALHNPRGKHDANPMTDVRGAQQWTVPQGYFRPLAMIALAYTEYLERYDATREAMAAVVVEARKNGARIPWSYWYDTTLRAEEYLSEPMVNDPICRLDCDIPVDAVACFVLTSAERARDLPHRPVCVAGYATGAPVKHRLPLHWLLDDVMAVGEETARRLWQRSGVGLTEVDLPQVYDGFSPIVYLWMSRCPCGPSGRRTAWHSEAASTATVATRCRCSRVEGRSGTDACTASHSCSSATWSWPVGRGGGSVRTCPSAWRVIPLRIMEAQWSTAPSRSEVPT